MTITEERKNEIMWKTVAIISTCNNKVRDAYDALEAAASDWNSNGEEACKNFWEVIGDNVAPNPVRMIREDYESSTDSWRCLPMIAAIHIDCL